MLNLAYGCDRSFLPHVAASILSAAKNGQVKIGDCFLFSSDVTEIELAPLAEMLLSEYSVNLSLRRVESSLLSEFQVGKHISPAAYLRLYIASLVPQDLDAILYLDGDTVVVGSLSKISTISNEIQAGVHDEGPTIWASYDGDGRHLEKFGYTSGKYFNSGVMLINLRRWRAKERQTELVEVGRATSGKLTWWDQDILNLVFQNDWMALDQQFNYQGGPLPPSVSIAHFTGDYKPWHFGCEHPMKSEYHSIRRLSPYRKYGRSKAGRFLYKKLFPRQARKGVRKWLVRIVRFVKRRFAPAG